MGASFYIFRFRRVLLAAVSALQQLTRPGQPLGKRCIGFVDGVIVTVFAKHGPTLLLEPDSGWRFFFFLSHGGRTSTRLPSEC